MSGVVYWYALTTLFMQNLLISPNAHTFQYALSRATCTHLSHMVAVTGRVGYPNNCLQSNGILPLWVARALFGPVNKFDTKIVPQILFNNHSIYQCA